MNNTACSYGGRPALFLATWAAFLMIAACGPAHDGPENEPSAPADITDQLPPNADLQAVAAHMLAARTGAQTTGALALWDPDLDRETGFEIQRIGRETQVGEGEQVIGWKMGGTRVAGAVTAPDPIYGYALASGVYGEGAEIPASRFVSGEPMVESEIVIWIGKDLPGPEITWEDFLAAVDGVGAGIELVSARARMPDGSTPPTNHLLADNVAHAAALVGSARMPVDGFDFDAETATIAINGEDRASGNGAPIMGAEGTPLEAAFALATLLPQKGSYLKAGEFVLTGSLYDNPTMKAGDRAEARFSTLGTLSFSLTDDTSGD